MDSESRKYTAFSIFGEHYELFRMPFGLSNAPKTFQRAMNRLLGHLECVKIFIDDVLIHSENIENHRRHVTQVLEILKANNVSINFDKSRFFKTQVCYLGHFIDKDGSRADVSRLVPFHKLISNIKKKLQRLLGVLNWYRLYIPNLSVKILDFTDKLKKDINFKWTSEDTMKFSKIYDEIKQQILLYFPDPNKPFELETDASDRGLGAILKQEHNMVGIYSVKFNQSELNYSIVEKEMLAIAKSLLHFKNIIFNSKVIVKTDNRDIIHLGPLSKRVERWKAIFEEFQIEMKYIQGKNNYSADTLSRIYFFNQKRLVMQVKVAKSYSKSTVQLRNINN
ncbi:Retrovirus-related Pol polyprotein from transposon 17.6 [Dictyocoela muelleri]|nr:Retrovirus-related Pol polyprotein from transposon 17.6 [Dictyocoela muelleri]